MPIRMDILRECRFRVVFLLLEMTFRSVPVVDKPNPDCVFSQSQAIDVGRDAFLWSMESPPDRLAVASHYSDLLPIQNFKFRKSARRLRLAHSLCVRCGKSIYTVQSFEPEWMWCGNDLGDRWITMLIGETCSSQ
jgi:hypothetical protein